MEENLISKKELLSHFGISYGALYRWKRKGLIPEDWFIHRSTPTGQETYFLRSQILPRIQLILEGKDSASLDELAQQLEEKPERRRLIVETGHGKKEFYLDEILSLTLVQEEKMRDLTPILKEDLG